MPPACVDVVARLRDWRKTTRTRSEVGWTHERRCREARPNVDSIITPSAASLRQRPMEKTETTPQASLPRLVRNWSDLASLPESETHRLEIDVANCNGWIIEKRPIKGYNYYLSTHTFYGGKHEYSTRILRECGWNVVCANWDIPNAEPCNVPSK